MSSGLAILDLGHLGIPGGGHGAEHDGLREVDLTPVYAVHAAQALVALGHDVLLWPDRLASYAARHARAVALARGRSSRVAYAQCHLNAGAGDYSIQFWAAERPTDEALARSVATALEGLPGIARSLRRGARTDDWTSRAHTCVAGLVPGPPNLAGLCCEPAFLDRPEHAPLFGLGGLREIGSRLATGIDRWLDAG